MSDRGGYRADIFWLQIVYLIILFGAAYVYLVWPQVLGIPDSLGPVPTGVPWYGALGAVLISLTGVFQHARDWEPSFKYWHWSRPIVGAAMAVIAVLILQTGLLSIGSSSQPQQATLFYIIAFLVAYREETFRELIKRVGDVILTPTSPPVTPTATKMTPAEGPLGGGTLVTITGQGLTAATEVKFGTAATFQRIDSDVQLTVTSPPASAAGPVPVVVIGKGGNSTPGQFTYR